jgi:hypothetical protein
MWRLVEPLHSITYFSPQALEATASRGLRGFWRGYMATRLAPLGSPGLSVAQAVLYGFEPAFTARSVPSVWGLITPAEALVARLEGAVATLRAAMPAPLGDDELSLLRRVALSVDTTGRVLAAANADLEWPGDPWADLWHATTVLREHRGDGHIAILVAEGLSGLDAHVLRAAADGGRQWLQDSRGWSDAQWEAAAEGLRSSGFLDGEAEITDAGRDLRAAVEAQTDALSEHPWDVLSDEELTRLDAALVPPAKAVAGSVVPVPNPVGNPAP